MIPHQGAILFLSKNSFYGKVLQFRNNMQITHCAVVSYPHCSISSMQELYTQSIVKPFDASECIVGFKVKDRIISETRKQDAIRYLYAKHGHRRSTWQVQTEALYWYLDRLGTNIQSLRPWISPRSFTIAQALQFVVEQSYFFDKLDKS
jgi:hypothetical protein